jgi:hypothetical protein
MPMERGTVLRASPDLRAEPEPLAPGRDRAEWRGLASAGRRMPGGFSLRIAG